MSYTKRPPLRSPLLRGRRGRRLWQLLGTLLFTVSAADGSNADWPQFRGPNCSGVGTDATPPIQISPTNGVLWKAAVSWAPSSPCVSGGKIFLTTVADGELQTVCYDGKDGRLLWSRGVRPAKLELFYNSGGRPAAATPAADGQ